MSKINIVMYHYVRNIKESRYPNIKGLEYELFKEQIEWMSKNYQFVTIEDIIGCYETGESLPSNAMLLTFDDGYIDNLFDKLIEFFKDYCSEYLKEDVSRAEWDYDDYFTEHVRMAIREENNPLNV